MTNFDDELYGLEQQFGMHERMEKVRKRFEAFLRARGLDELEGESDERRFAIAELELKILYLATLWLVLDVQVRYAPADEAAYRAKMRMSVITDLWHEGLWVEPWISLVDQEFPGPELTGANLEQILADGPEKVEGRLRTNYEYQTIMDEMVAFLVERGYNVQAEDMMMLQTCVLEVITNRRDIGSKNRSLGDQLQRMQNEASDPHHSAWQEFVQHFFQVSQA
jgi:hypothetical protein